MNLSQALSVLFPNAQPRIDYHLADDGSGARITFWNPDLGAQPTQVEIDAVTQAQVDAAFAAQEPLFQDLKEDAETAILNNETFLLLATPTNAQYFAQVKALTRQMNRTIKVVMRMIAQQGR